jgi:hypothetical protein
VYCLNLVYTRFSGLTTRECSRLAAAQRAVVDLEFAHDAQASPRPRSRRRPSAVPWSASPTSIGRRNARATQSRGRRVTRVLRLLATKGLHDGHRLH